MKRILMGILLLLFISTSATALHLPDCKKGVALKTIGYYSITPTIQLEIIELDFPEYDLHFDLGWLEGDLNWFGDWLGVWSIDAGVGNDLLMFSLNKTLVPIVDIQAGVFIGYDFDKDDGGFETGFVFQAIIW